MATVMRRSLCAAIIIASQSVYGFSLAPLHGLRGFVARRSNTSTRSRALWLRDESLDTRFTAVAAGAAEEREKERAMKRGLDFEFIKIGLPSLVQFTASPLCALVDAMYGWRQLGTCAKLAAPSAPSHPPAL